jgi:protein tyrosine phosphatase (PTP) superfamily phosphohydrolase (DUF442 family)
MSHAPPSGRPARLGAWAAVMLRDGGLVRLVLPNRHRVAEGVWRSGQPTPGQLRAFARAGGRTVISLRAGRAVAALAPEAEACRALGLAFHLLPMRGHRLPTAAELAAAVRLFAAAERPVLIHCQSGADRAGLGAALWLLLAEGCPVAEARRQLSPRFGHNPLGRAGLLGALLDAYAAAPPMPFAEWAATAYDPGRITAEWRALPLAARLRRWLAR